MKQGTISVLVGSHSVIHSFLVLRSWKILYGKYPKPWKVGCIFLHDVGHWGKNYLDNVNEKREHWNLGARIAGKLFGLKAFYLIAGHDAYSGYKRSDLYKPDKYSWYIAPYWWLCWNNIVEPKIRCNMGSREAILDFRNNVKKNIESGQFNATHDLYIERLNNANRTTK